VEAAACAVRRESKFVSAVAHAAACSEDDSARRTTPAEWTEGAEAAAAAAERWRVEWRAWERTQQALIWTLFFCLYYCSTSFFCSPELRFHYFFFVLPFFVFLVCENKNVLIVRMFSSTISQFNNNNNIYIQCPMNGTPRDVSAHLANPEKAILSSDQERFHEVGVYEGAS